MNPPERSITRYKATAILEALLHLQQYVQTLEAHDPERAAILADLGTASAALQHGIIALDDPLPVYGSLGSLKGIGEG